MSLIYLIDGYNLTNHPAFIRQLNKKISDKRSALLDLIKTKRLTGSPRNRVLVVFDGYGEISCEEAVFSHDESADEKIMALLEKCAQPKNAVVVSDDREIKAFAKFKRAKAMSVEDFFAAAPENKVRRAETDSTELKINYTQANKINQELRKLWLK